MHIPIQIRIKWAIW